MSAARQRDPSKRVMTAWAPEALKRWYVQRSLELGRPMSDLMIDALEAHRIVVEHRRQREADERRKAD